MLIGMHIHLEFWDWMLLGTVTLQSAAIAYLYQRRRWPIVSAIAIMALTYIVWAMGLVRILPVSGTAFRIAMVLLLFLVWNICCLNGFERILCRTSRTESIGTFLEIRLEYRFQYHLRRCLYHSVFQCR